MKIIALLPIKDEEWILPTYISSIKQVAEEIIAIHDGLADNSKKIVEDAGGFVFDNSLVGGIDPDDISVDKLGWPEKSIRNNLLKLGREHGGTHFICLDADEAFTAPFINNFKKYIEKLKPGQVLSLQWLALWKDSFNYRDDSSVWSNNFKNFIFFDDGKSEYDNFDKKFTIQRTPGVIGLSDKIIVPLSEGAVFHFQFSNWRAFQIKQSLYRCRELIVGDWSAKKINSSFAITLDNMSANVSAVPLEWQRDIVLPKESENIASTRCFLDVIALFDRYEVGFFEPLQIWHIPEFKQEFFKRIGRRPVSKVEFIGYKLVREAYAKLMRRVKLFLRSIYVGILKK